MLTLSLSVLYSLNMVDLLATFKCIECAKFERKEREGLKVESPKFFLTKPLTLAINATNVLF